MRPRDEQVYRLVDGVAAGLEDVVVVLTEAVQEPEVGDSGLLSHFADGGLLEFLAALDATFRELPVPGPGLQQQVLAAATRVAKEDRSRARGLYHTRQVKGRAVNGYRTPDEPRPGETVSAVAVFQYDRLQSGTDARPSR